MQVTTIIVKKEVEVQLRFLMMPFFGTQLLACETSRERGDSRLGKGAQTM